ncbi:MAG: tRNA 2-thiocytidine biosynthesis protein TtcA [Desulfotalea sp.]
MANYKLPAQFNKLLGKAMHDYKMLNDGDRVIIGLSGGVDSLALAWILQSWQQKAPISYKVLAITIDNGYWHDDKSAVGPRISIGPQMEQLGIEYRVEKSWYLDRDDMTCYLCSRNRRNQLFEIAKNEGYNKIALGHHKDDLLETFMMNALYSGNISTMLPHQRLFDDSLGIIRPMAYLEKDNVVEIAKGIGVEAVKNYCPLADNTRREQVRGILADIYKREPKAKKSLFSSLGNVRKDYMLLPAKK